MKKKKKKVLKQHKNAKLNETKTKVVELMNAPRNDPNFV